MNVAVIGAGSWGTALSQVLAENGCTVRLWARKHEVVDAINTTHHNPRYLSDTILSKRIVADTSYEQVLQNAQALVVVTPSSVMRGIAVELAKYASSHLPIILCFKGAEQHSAKLPFAVFDEVLGSPQRFAVLSGPNHAEEVVKGMPSGTVIASCQSSTGSFFQRLFASSNFRTYVSDDVCGVELCAAFKNIIAIAVGLSYGLGYGDNTAAMLMTRGLAEMSRLVVKAGGKSLTCMGLAGMGDLVATCTSEHSRNRRLGVLLAQGGGLNEFTEQTHMVAEGALASRTLGILSERYGVDLPVTDVVRDIVWNKADPHMVAQTLASRPLTTEFYGL